ncbi:MAG: prolipoprotein diacylglyceryl transferase [Tepidisphaeraceae bacterium]
MYPELFRLPFIGYSVHSYGLMLVLGLLGGIELAKFLARRSNLNPELFANAAILALVSGLVGARIAYVIQFHNEFTGGTFWENLWNAANLTSGGLVYYGGFLLAFPTLVLYAIWKKIPLLRGMDIIAPCLMIGLALGRVGCFLNGCCWGQHTTLSWPVAVTFPYQSSPYIDDLQEGKVSPPDALYKQDFVKNSRRLMTKEEIQAQHDLATLAESQRSLPVINTQLMSTVTALMIAAVATAFFTLGKIPGRGFAVMMMLEGLTRFLIEGLRVEPDVIVLGKVHLTLSMLIGLGVAAGGVVLWIAAGLAARTKDRTPVETGVPVVA